jgi:hypothetical protein
VLRYRPQRDDLSRRRREDRRPVTALGAARTGRAQSQPMRCFAALKTWEIFTKIRCSPSSIGQLAQAVLTLHLGLPE